MKIVFIILVLPILLYSEYLYVGSQNQTGSTDGVIQIEDITKTLSTALKVDDTNIIVDIPIYVKTDSLKEVVLNISNIANLKNSSNEEINTELYWVAGGVETTINEASDFTILNAFSGDRDGNTVVGYIRVKIPSVESSQTDGSYSFTDKIKTGLKFLGGASYSSDSDFTFNSEVALVAVASFLDTSSYKEGQKFVGGMVDFGTFSFDVNTKTKNLYIKSNSTKTFKITFTNTPALTHESDNTQTINVNYYFNDTQITANNPFTPLIGKSDGTSSLGTLKFQTEAISGSKLAGTYRATVNVSITLE